MNILFLTAHLPEPPHAGGTLRTNGLLRGVHAAGHSVHLLSFADADQARQHRDTLAEFCASITTVEPPQRSLTQRLRDLAFTQRADMQGRFASPQFARQLEQLLAGQRFDLVQIESLEMAIYLPIIQKAGVRAIYDSFNAEYDLQRTIYETERGSLRRLPGAFYSLLQWRRLTHFERSVCQNVAHTIAVSEADAAAFEQLAPGCPVSVVPNGINTANYAHTDASLDLGEYPLVFTGSMAYRPNVDAALWFAYRVLPLVREKVPGVRFFVVGSNPHARLNVLHEQEAVEITGWVPDVNPFLHAAAVYVVPMRMGSGTRLKVLQALAASKAVVSTTIGAQGLHVTDGEQLRLADSPQDFAAAVIELLEQPDQRENLGAAAQRYVCDHYDWSVIVPRLLRVYDQL